MPLYEYVCEETGEVVELLRPLSDADKPIEDPEGKGRRFVRRLSTFAAHANGASKSAEMPVCPSGRCSNPGMCGMN